MCHACSHRPAVNYNCERKNKSSHKFYDIKLGNVLHLCSIDVAMKAYVIYELIVNQCTRIIIKLKE